MFILFTLAFCALNCKVRVSKKKGGETRKCDKKTLNKFMTRCFTSAKKYVKNKKLKWPTQPEGMDQETD